MLEKHTVILVSDMVDKKTAEDMHMIHANNLESALVIARGLKGDVPVTVIPDGVSVIVEK